MSVFGERLKELQEECGKTFHQIERESGVSKSSLAYWCRTDAMPNSSSVIQLVKYFGVSADWILGISNFRTIKK